MEQEIHREALVNEELKTKWCFEFISQNNERTVLQKGVLDDGGLITKVVLRLSQEQFHCFLKIERFNN